MQHLQVNQTTAPSLFKLGACLIYEALVVIALLLICTALFILLFGDAAGLKRYFLQLFLWLATGAYFVWCWRKKGQTLAMQTWQLKILNQELQLLSVEKAMLRYGLATIGLLVFGLGFLWVLVDRENLFLHDRLLNNKLIFFPRKKAS